MRKIILQFLLFTISCSVSGQWVQKSSFPGGTRTKATSFRIENKIYLLGGLNTSNVILRDLWEYNIATDTWQRKADFPGPERYGAASFVMNDVAYISTGGNDNGYLDDLWQYNSITDTWVQKNGLPAGMAQHENQRVEAFAFVIGNRAYLGGGNGFVFGPNSTNNYAFFDLWEYNPAGSVWTHKSDIPDAIGRNMSIASVINDKAYIGLGCNVQQTVNHQTFWEYDPSTDIWTSKASFPSLFTTDANAFVLGQQLYVAGGVNLNPVSLSNQVYKYDPVADAWSQMPGFNGNEIAGAICESTDSLAFLGTGYRGNLTLRTDWWEYASLNTGVSFPVLKAEKPVNVFPNPFSENTTFYLGEGVQSCSIEIFDACGKRVRQVTISQTNNKLSRGDLSTGLYLYTVNAHGSIIDRGKLVVE